GFSKDRQITSQINHKPIEKKQPALVTLQKITQKQSDITNSINGQNKKFIYDKFMSCIASLPQDDMENQSNAINKAFFQILSNNEFLNWTTLLERSNKLYVGSYREIKLSRLKIHFTGDGTWAINQQLSKYGLKIRTDRQQNFWVKDLKTLDEIQIPFNIQS
ncbi:MAG: hypothetical protein AB1896_17485, partial [Thermodesulfobacteriota bacterium]